MLQLVAFMKNIYISGSVAYDEIMDFPGHFKDYFHPEKLHQINVSFAVDRLAKHLGGIATNIAYATALTNSYLRTTTSIHPLAAVGKDGDALIQFFRKQKIAVGEIAQIEALFTSTGKVITDENDNQIWGYYYGALAKYNPPVATIKPVKTDLWIVSATHERPFTKVLHHVIQHKLPYLFDPGMTLTWIRDDLLKKGVLHATYLVGNDYEIAMIEKRLNMKVDEMIKKGVNVIVTMGEKGVDYYGSARAKEPLRPRHLLHHYTPSFKVKKVTDPTGAGDAWRGGFAAALCAGLPISHCLAMGNVMGSFAVESVGTVEYQPTHVEIKKRFDSLLKKTK